MLTDTYRQSGGVGPVVLIRRVWVGEAPTSSIAKQTALYHSYAAQGAKDHWDEKPIINPDSPAALGDALAQVKESVDADCLNLRLHAPGIEAKTVARQIDLLGETVSLLRNNH
jgi:hypothetical protein